MKSKLKYVFYVLVALFGILQFFRPKLNTGSVHGSNDLNQVHEIPNEIEAIFVKACYDCHSNNTTYPWYTNIQPIGLWMQNHVDEGKEEFNFSEFASYSAKKQKHKIHEIEEVVEENEMHLNSYTWTHGDAVLSDGEKKLLIDWVKNCMKKY